MDPARVYIDQDQCTGCELCLSACGRKLIAMDQGTAFVRDPARCSQCGHCKSICPVNAPQLPLLNADDFTVAPSPNELPSPGQLLAFLRSRRSIRVFTRRQVDRNTAFSIIDAGRYAPTAQNRQALGFVAVLNAEKIEELRALTINVLVNEADRLEKAVEMATKYSASMTPEDQRFKEYPPAWRFMAELRKSGVDPLFHDAPAVVVCHVSPIESLHPEVEAGMASIQMALMAQALGMGTCFCALLDYAASHSRELKNFLKIPQDHMVPVSFILGYPDIRYSRLPARNPARLTWL